MAKLAGKKVLVVGASGAIGTELCIALMNEGAKVFGTAKNVESSIRLSGDLAQRLLLDLESPQSIEALTNFLLSQPEELDGIIFAAGLVAFGSIEATPTLITQRLMQVNALAPMQITTALLPKLQAASSAGRDPFILSISGVIAEQPMGGLAAYSASKTALHGFALAAAKELRKAGIDWIDARPGHTESGLASRAIFGTAPNFGTGKSVTAVASRMVTGILEQEKDLPSTSF